MATEIIKGLKRKIRIMWAVIVILSIALLSARCNINTIKETHKDALEYKNVFEKEIYYDIPKKTETNKNVITTDRKRRKR